MLCFTQSSTYEIEIEQQTQRKNVTTSTAVTCNLTVSKHWKQDRTACMSAGHVK